MVIRYPFYRKVKARDVPATILSESSVFNHVLTPTATRTIYGHLREDGHLLQRTSLTKFRDYLVSPEADLFTQLRLVRKADGTELVRLIPRNIPVSPYAIALSLAPHAYVSHYSALYLHGLTLNVPKPIYVKKRRTKPRIPVPGPVELTQAQLDAAFSIPARTTRNIYTFDYKDTTHEVYLLDRSAEVDNGITRIDVSHAPSGIDVSGVEKTLVECVVRPNYAGGAREVLDAFRRAKGTLRILRMMQLLNGGRYLFPYEKNILFYMERAGYPERQKDLVRQRSRPDRKKFTTYLEKNMHGGLLDPDIGIYYPEGMGTE